MMLGEDEDSNLNNSFSSKSVFARFSAIFAGPLFNFILAFIAAIVLISMLGYDVPKIDNLQTSDPLYQTGLKNGDIIVEYNNTNIKLYKDMVLYEYFNPMNSNKPVTVKVNRKGKILSFTLVPEHQQSYLLGCDFADANANIKVTGLKKKSPLKQAGVKVNDKILAINDHVLNKGSDLSKYLNENPLSDKTVTLKIQSKSKVRTVSVTPQLINIYNMNLNYTSTTIKTGSFSTFKGAIYEMGYWVKSTYKSIVTLITGKIGVSSLSGPVGIINSIGDSVKDSSSSSAKSIFITLLE